MTRRVIVNADDFGASLGINRAIAHCHCHGVVTSTSLMVTGGAVADAIVRLPELPELSVGLHFDLLGEEFPETFDLSDRPAVAAEFRRQLAEFERLTGRLPTHVDSHRHVHRRAGLEPLIAELVAPLGVPLRGDGRVPFAGGFYGQPEWLVPDLECVSAAALLNLIREHAVGEWLEVGCHPGYVTPDFESVYLAEREAEVATLADPRVREQLEQLGIELRSYRDYHRLRGA